MKKMRLLSRVLVKPLSDIRLEYRETSTGLVVSNHGDYNWIACQRGEVLQVPSTEDFDKRKWQSDFVSKEMEVKIGDIVYWRPLVEKHLIEMGEVFQDGTAPIKYEKLYLAIRGEEVIMLNGYMLIELEKEEEGLKSEIIHLLEKPKKFNKVTRYGTVKHLGKKLEKYYPNTAHEMDEIEEEIEIGDRLGFQGRQVNETYNDIMGCHPQIKDLVYAQRKDLLAKVG